jgi:hypothetical protein
MMMMMVMSVMSVRSQKNKKRTSQFERCLAKTIIEYVSVLQVEDGR